MRAVVASLARGSARFAQAEGSTSPLGLCWATPAWACVLSALALSLIGTYAIDLAQRPVAEAGEPIDPLALKHLVLAAAGVVAGAIVVVPHYRLIAVVAWPAMLVSIALLVVLLMPAVPSWLVSPRNGTRGWIDLGVFDLQPAEPAKVAYVLAMAHHLRYRRHYRRLAGLIPPVLITAVPVGLITLQPDLGSALVFLPVLLAVLIAAGARVRHLVLAAVVATSAAPAAYPLLKPYQRQRIVALVEHLQGRADHADDVGFQPLTAQRLIGAGGLRGTTDAHARALVHFNRLPERHNDMIVAVVAVRGGVIAVAGIVALTLLWAGAALGTAARCFDPFGRLVCVGCAAFVVVQMFVNVGMCVGLLPIIGVPLPFVSAGGSSLLTAWVMTGLVMNVGLRRPIPPLRPSFEFDAEDG